MGGGGPTDYFSLPTQGKVELGCDKIKLWIKVGACLTKMEHLV